MAPGCPVRRGVRPVVGRLTERTGYRLLVVFPFSSTLDSQPLTNFPPLGSAPTFATCHYVRTLLRYNLPALVLPPDSHLSRRTAWPVRLCPSSNSTAASPSRQQHRSPPWPQPPDPASPLPPAPNRPRSRSPRP